MSPILCDTVNYADWTRRKSIADDCVACTQEDTCCIGYVKISDEELCLEMFWISCFILLRKSISGLFYLFIFIIHHTIFARSWLSQIMVNGQLIHNCRVMWRAYNENKPFIHPPNDDRDRVSKLNEQWTSFLLYKDNTERCTPSCHIPGSNHSCADLANLEQIPLFYAAVMYAGLEMSSWL